MFIFGMRNFHSGWRTRNEKPAQKTDAGKIHVPYDDVACVCVQRKPRCATTTADFMVLSPLMRHSPMTVDVQECYRTGTPHAVSSALHCR